MKILDPRALAEIQGLVRCEEYDQEALGEIITDLTHTVYSHEQIYGEFCTIHGHINCPPEIVFEYLADPYCLLEWTYSVRELAPIPGKPGLLLGVDSRRTPFYCRTTSSREALTVDYRCAWDQGDELWMIYLNRVVPAEEVLHRPGSVIIWTNCRHPYYDKNPFPALNKDPKRPWVGDWWPLFFAGHTVELANLKKILEHRWSRGLPIGPYLKEAA